MSVAVKIDNAKLSVLDGLKVIDWSNDNHLDSNGEVICGIYRGMPDYVYHGTKGYSSSMFKDLAATSPLHIKRKYIDKMRKPIARATQRVFNTGTLLHELVLETERFYTHYYKLPEDTGFTEYKLEDLKAKAKALGLKISGTRADLKTRINDAVDEKDRIVEYNDKVEEIIKVHSDSPLLDELINAQTGRTTLYSDIWMHEKNFELPTMPITFEEWDWLHEMFDAVCEDPLAASLLSSGEPELSFFGVCPTTGLLLKCRFDWLNSDGYAVDLKSCRCAEDRKFNYHANDLGYDLQHVFYEYVASLCDVSLKHFLFLAVEKDCPIADLKAYDVDSIARAKTKLHRYLHTFKECLETDQWHGYKKQRTISVLRNRKGF